MLCVITNRMIDFVIGLGGIMMVLYIFGGLNESHQGILNF